MSGVGLCIAKNLKAGVIPAAPLPFRLSALGCMGPLKAAPVSRVLRSGWVLGGSGGAPAPARMGSAAGRARVLLAGGDGVCAPAAVPQFPLRASAASERLPCGDELMAVWPGVLGGAAVLPWHGRTRGAFAFYFGE